MTEAEAERFTKELEYAIHQTEALSSELINQLNSLEKLITQLITLFNK